MGGAAPPLKSARSPFEQEFPPHQAIHLSSDRVPPELSQWFQHFPNCSMKLEDQMKKYVLAATMMIAVAAPAMADDVGVQVGPVGAGVTVGRVPDRDRDHTTVIKEREPRDRTTVIKKEHDDGTRSKTVIHDRD
jgi:hypothetical protein